MLQSLQRLPFAPAKAQSGERLDYPSHDRAIFAIFPFMQAPAQILQAPAQPDSPKNEALREIAPLAPYGLFYPPRGMPTHEPKPTKKTARSARPAKAPPQTIANRPRFVRDFRSHARAARR